MKTKNIIVGTFFLLFLFGCKSPVDRAQTHISEKLDANIGKDLLFFTSIIDFYWYANPVNYWYPEEYTYRDILNDKFRHGYQGLTKLDDRLSTIQTDDKIINSAITDLRKEITIAQKNIKKKQSSIENLNSFSYGGMRGLLDLNSALSTSKEREEAEEKNRAMPSNVEDAFFHTVDLLEKKIQSLDSSIFNFEKEVFEISKPNLDEKTQIRSNYEVYITKEIRKNFRSNDTVSMYKMVNELFSHYNKTFILK